MNPTITGDGKIDKDVLKRKVRTLQVHVKLPMLIAGFILVNGLAAVCLPPLDRAHPSWRAPLTAHRRAPPRRQISCLLHPLWIAIPFYLVAFLILNYAANYSTSANLLRLLGYRGPQFYCNTACVRQSYGEVNKQSVNSKESKMAHSCFCAGLSLFEYVRGRPNAFAPVASNPVLTTHTWPVCAWCADPVSLPAALGALLDQERSTKSRLPVSSVVRVRAGDVRHD